MLFIEHSVFKFDFYPMSLKNSFVYLKT